MSSGAIHILPDSELERIKREAYERGLADGNAGAPLRVSINEGLFSADTVKRLAEMLLAYQKDGGRVVLE